MSRKVQPPKVGDIFTRLTVVKVDYMHKEGHYYHLCLCSCGKEKIIAQSNLLKGKSKSCGCISIENARNRATHGMSKTDIYQTWNRMWSRCTNPIVDRYKNYGGRGITVCDEWKNFENFFADMGDKPTRKHSLGRIDNNKNYCKENCRWETPIEQANNTSTNRFIEIDGERKTISQWARQYGLDAPLIWQRYERGVRPPELFSTENFNEKYIIHNGVRKLTTQWMKDSKIPISSFYLMKRKGLTDQQIIQKYTDKNKRK